MRVIAGALGSRPLASVPGERTRPTSARVKEALFSRLEAQSAIAGARVLDLYAGSAALGVEAASRGAAAVDSVEAAAVAARVARANAALTRTDGGEPVVRVHLARVEVFLERAADSGDIWDLVLADPPYDLTETSLNGVLHLIVPVCVPGALIVIERRRSCPEPLWPVGVTGGGQRTYGDTRLWFAIRDACSALSSGAPAGEND